MSDVWASITDISVHLAHDADVLVAVEKRVFVLPLGSRPARATMRCFVGLKAGIRKHDDEPLCILVGGGDRDVLLGH